MLRSRGSQPLTFSTRTSSTSTSPEVTGEVGMVEGTAAAGIRASSAIMASPALVSPAIAQASGVHQQSAGSHSGSHRQSA
eukprot:1759834-Alexandrium_andersonii.AAC.1